MRLPDWIVAIVITLFGFRKVERLFVKNRRARK